MRAALIRDGQVQAVILVGEDYEPPQELEFLPLSDDSPAGPGWRWDGVELSEPQAPEPESEPVDPVSELQATVAAQQEVIDFLVTYITEGV